MKRLIVILGLIAFVNTAQSDELLLVDDTSTLTVFVDDQTTVSLSSLVEGAGEFGGADLTPLEGVVSKVRYDGLVAYAASLHAKQLGQEIEKELLRESIAGVIQASNAEYENRASSKVRLAKSALSKTIKFVP